MTNQGEKKLNGTADKRPGLVSIGYQPVAALADGDVVKVTEPSGAIAIRTAYKVTHRTGTTTIEGKAGIYVLNNGPDDTVEVFVERT